MSAVELVVETPQVVTSEQLASAILQEAGLEPDEMDNLRRAVRLPGGWEVGHPFPPFPQTHVIDSMFVGAEGAPIEGDHVPGDVRVYARPTSFTMPDGEPSPFFRATISSSGRTRLDSFSLQSFIEDVAGEYSAMVVEEDEDSPEETCGSCTAELPEGAKFCAACGAPVRRCGACTTIADVPHKFCAACGVPLP
jgi:hypothetical protein